jgi:hypothetical protein
MTLGPDSPEILRIRLQELRDAALALQFTAVEDRPAGDAALLDILEDEIATLLATVLDAVAAAAAVPRAPDRRHARALLRRCHALVDGVALQLAYRTRQESLASRPPLAIAANIRPGGPSGAASNLRRFAGGTGS